MEGGGGGCCEKDGNYEDGDRKRMQQLFCLCLEDYMDFGDDPLHRPDFIIDQLNHIIFMHGFIRMHRRHKAEIMRTLEAMELMEAPRSTLEESISRCAPLAVEVVRRDLQAIGWQGCPLGSVQSVGLPHAAAVTIASPVSAAPARGDDKAKKKQKEEEKAANTSSSCSRLISRRRKKRKRAQPQFPLLTMGPTDEAPSF